MSQQQIAMQAAEELHEYFEHVRSDVLAVPDIDVTAALILTAAAKMVQQSGAVQVLHAYNMAWGAEKHAEEHIIHPDEPSGESAALWRDADRLLEDAKRLHKKHREGIAALRSITGEERQ